MGYLQKITVNRNYRNRLWILLLLFMIMYLSDLILTLYGLKVGLLVEENPLIRGLLRHGVAGVTFFKLGLPGAFVAAVSLCLRVNPQLAVWGTVVVLVLYTSIALYHLTSVLSRV